MYYMNKNTAPYMPYKYADAAPPPPVNNCQGNQKLSLATFVYGGLNTNLISLRCPRIFYVCAHVQHYCVYAVLYEIYCIFGSHLRRVFLIFRSD